MKGPGGDGGCCNSVPVSPALLRGIGNPAVVDFPSIVANNPTRDHEAVPCVAARRLGRQFGRSDVVARSAYLWACGWKKANATTLVNDGLVFPLLPPAGGGVVVTGSAAIFFKSR